MIKAALSVILAVVAIAIGQTTVLADTTPPTTTLLKQEGTLGANGWYTSTVNISLKATDIESGPASTTYTLDSNSPITRLFAGTTNSVLNPSFESGSLYTITNWDKISSGFTSLYQSHTPTRTGNGSAAILTLLSGTQYWTNVNSASVVMPGSVYTASGWVKTFNLINGPGAWMEAWAADSTGIKSDVQVATSNHVYGDWDWALLKMEFTVPLGYNRIYLKLGDNGSIGGYAFFDDISLNAGNGGITEFSVVDNGIHSLSYYSTDNDNNKESTHVLSPIKIDTVAPQNWSNFDYTGGGNNHQYTMWVNVRDVTSGINPATAQFQTFDKNGCDCWSAWQSVSSVTRLDNGATAPAGYTGYVVLKVNSYDYGNSAKATKPEIQFRIDDMASTLNISPAYALFGPWIQLSGGGDIYSGGNITISGLTPSGQSAADGLVISGGSQISNLVSLKNWTIVPYTVSPTPSVSLADYIPEFDTLQQKATSLAGGRLPSTSGIYSFDGKFTIDSNTLTAGFQGAVINAVVIINGDLAINDEFELNSASGIVFLVTGNVIYKDSVVKSAGFIVSAGQISTGNAEKTLVHTGALIGLGGVNLGRDLGRKGNPNNSTTPAERIIFPPQILQNQGMARLLNGGASTNFHWQEQ